MKKILFIDDDIYILKAIKRKLRKYEKQLFFEKTLKSGKKVLETKKIDILFIDYNLNEMTAIEFLEKTKVSLPKEIYLLTASQISIESDLIKNILTKPIKYNKLIDIIEGKYYEKNN